MARKRKKDPRNLPYEEQCPECCGHRYVSVLCYECGGEGVDADAEDGTCQYCLGFGEDDEPCEDCGGTGTLEGYESVRYREHINSLVIKRYGFIKDSVADYWISNPPP